VFSKRRCEAEKKTGYSLSRILFESLVSIRFMSSEIVPAEIATAEKRNRTAPAIAQPMRMILTAFEKI